MFVLSLALMLAAQTATTPPAPAGALQPQQTSPLPGATPPTPTAPPAPVPSTGQSVVAPPPLGRVFAAEQGLIFNAIKPDKVMDFEIVIAKLREALANSADPVRNQQAAGWKIYKAVEPGPNASVLYVFVMDPAVKGADYGVAKILAEAYPLEIMELYRMYTTAFAPAGQTLVNLQPVLTPETTIGVPGTATGLSGTTTGTNGVGGTTPPVTAPRPSTPRPQAPSPQVP